MPYTAINDPYFSQPYIDEAGWRDTPQRHYFVHGGFHGTEKMGQEVKFCFYLPEKSFYQGRFFQYLSPAPEDERASEYLTGVDDKIAFCLSHGSAYVVSNQGGFVPGDGERLYKSSANTAQYFRQFARDFYGTNHRPYGYCFGGSGGSFKTMGCVEATEGVWDGGVPYVIANPMATPNVFSPLVRVMRLLGEAGMNRLTDAMLPGGSGDLYAGLDEEQRSALEELTAFGFPKKAWIAQQGMDDGALMVLTPTIYQIMPTYFRDFWEKEGYLGADPASSESRARVCFQTTVKALAEREQRTAAVGEHTDVNDAWINTMIGNQTTPHILPEALPPAGSFLFRCRLRVLSGSAAGKEQPIDRIENGLIHISAAFDGQNGGNALEGLAPGDAILIDNSDYLALQSFQRHQVPDASYYTYDMYRNPDGTSKYPQQPLLIAPLIAMGGGGCVPTGNIHSKMIINCSLLDGGAYPWHGDWYLKRIAEAKGGTEDWARLYFNDYCVHSDHAVSLRQARTVTDYAGMLYQSLLDLAAWAEQGIEPARSTAYRLENGQVEVENNAARQGLQPVVESWVNGGKCVRIRPGETVRFTARAEATAGSVTWASWEFEEGTAFDIPLTPTARKGKAAFYEASHTYLTPGTYFPVIKTAASRDPDDFFTQCRNLSICRVIVTE